MNRQPSWLLFNVHWRFVISTFIYGKYFVKFIGAQTKKKMEKLFAYRISIYDNTRNKTRKKKTKNFWIIGKLFAQKTMQNAYNNMQDLHCKIANFVHTHTYYFLTYTLTHFYVYQHGFFFSTHHPEYNEPSTLLKLT